MAWHTTVTDRLGIELPLIGAPMGGGPTTPALVAAVSEAGGLGSVAGGYLPPSRLADEIGAVRQRTARPFAVNLFATEAPPVDDAQLEHVLVRLESLRLELGLPPRPTIGRYAEDLDAQLAVVEAAHPAVVSFTFGLLPQPAVDRLHAAGCVLIGTATTVAEAVALEEAGTDLICAQGAEAGAHHGSFLGDQAHSFVGTLALIPQVCDAVSVPVIAAGGIMDGRGLAAVLVLGAGAAQLGTALLQCPEAGTAAAYREALASATETSTALTQAVTGRWARGIRNRLMSDLAEESIPPYPVMNALTSELRRVAGSQGKAELMSLWCGQGIRLAQPVPARDLVQQIARQAQDELGATAYQGTGHTRAAMGDS